MKKPCPCRAAFRMFLCALLFVSLAGAVRAQKRSTDLTSVSIEDLLQMRVTSVSREQEPFSASAAAIFVITQEDIRRSGATSIPELLRMVPGLDVAQIDANKWAISSRGFNGRFANKMLVLMDGRTVCSPLFSGVYWDVQDTLLEDIERIEVVRGPGATLWGTNAVNGVINIITKRAGDTQGGLMTAGGGNQERGLAAIRYGGKIRDRAYYRFFAKYFDRNDSLNSNSQAAADGWNILRGGFRTDWTLSGRDSLTVQGDFYNGSAGETVPELVSLSPPVVRLLNDRNHLVGGNVLARWNRTFSPRSDATLQFYYDRSDRRDIEGGEIRHTADFDFQHHILLGSRHNIVWGLGYRFTTDQTVGSLTVSFNPSSRGDNLFNAFVQDEILLVPDRLRLTLGTKFEHNDYSGSEIQPNIRLLWTPHSRHAIWAAVSRATRSPARADAGLRANLAAFRGVGGTTTVLSLFGNPQFENEKVLATELGYRAQWSKRLSVDLAGYYNVYERLRVAELGTPFFESSPSPAHLVIPSVFQNALHGNTHGIEVAANWNLTSRWKLSSGYTWLQADLRGPAGVTLRPALGVNAPQQQWNLRSYLNLPGNLEFDSSLYYVGRLSSMAIPGYTRLDTRLGWRATESFEISVVGQNLLKIQHFEFNSSSDVVSATQVKRSVFGKLTWRF